MGVVSTPWRTDRSASMGSRWWYGVAALPVVSVLAVAAIGLGTAIAVFSGALDSDAAGPVFGFLVLLGMVSVAAVIAAGLVLPAALYFDTRAINAGDFDWRPDVSRYAALGLLGAFVHPVGIAVACWYLYRRHQGVGAP